MTESATVTHLREEDLLDDPLPSGSSRAGLSRRRRVAALVVALVALPLLTLLLNGARDTLSLEGQVLLYLLVVVLVALIGGMIVALPAAVAAALLINYYFVEPLHTLDVNQSEQALALAIFVAVAAIVSGAVELADRRARAAELAARQAETLSSLAGTDLEETDNLRTVLEQARETFGMESVVLLSRHPVTGEWREEDHAGRGVPGGEAALRFDVPIGLDLRLVGRGPALFANDQRVLRAFAAAAETAYGAQRLTREAREARDLAALDRQRTALLAAVGHDLRTPLAGITAAVTTLQQDDVDWSSAERAELLDTISQSADRLEALVSNLLDASRLQAGALGVVNGAVALDEVVSAAVLAVPGARDRVRLDVPEDLPLVQADAGLLERVLVNLIDNAMRHGGDGPIEIKAVTGADSAKITVSDEGPGIAGDRHEEIFAPFHRLSDSEGGVGLGLSVARGFTEAMHGALAVDPSSRRGVTMRVRLPLAKAPQ